MKGFSIWSPISLAILLLWVISQVQASNLSTPAFNGGVYLDLRGIYFGRGLNEDYALDIVGRGDGENTNSTVNSKHDFGYKLGLGFLIPRTGNDLQLTYAYFNKNGFNAKEPSGEPLLSLSGESQFSSILIDVDQDLQPVTIEVERIVGGQATTIPITLNFSKGSLHISDTLTTNFKLANASTHRSYKFIDVNFGQYLRVNNLLLRIFSGLRYAHVRQKLTANYSGSSKISDLELNDSAGTLETTQVTRIGVPPVLVTITIPANFITEELAENIQEAIFEVTENYFQSNHFDGLAPSFGFDAKVELGHHFYIHANLLGAVVVGKNKNNLAISLSEYLDAEFGAAVDDYELNSNFFKYKSTEDWMVVSNVESSVALNYVYSFTRTASYISFEAGYFISGFFGQGANSWITENKACCQIFDNFNGPYFEIRVAL